MYSLTPFNKDQITSTSLGVLETLANKLNANAKVSLIACFTGMGTNNIAQSISNLYSKATIFSPTEEYLLADCDSFKISDNGSCIFKSGNFISSLFETRRNITKIYQDGQVVK